MRSVAVFVIWVISSLSPVFSHAGEDVVIYALFTRGWPPLEMVENGKGTGVAVELFKAVMPEDVEATVQLVPRARAQLRNHEPPVYARLEARSWFEHPEAFWWSDPVFTLRNVLYSPTGVPFEYEGVQSLEGKTIGCIRNYNYPQLAPLFETGKAVRYDVNRDHLLLRMVQNGRVDVAVMDAVTARWIIRKRSEFRPESFHVSKRPLAVTDIRFAFNKVPGWDSHLPEINRRIKSRRKSGEIRRIFSNYE